MTTPAHIPRRAQGAARDLIDALLAGNADSIRAALDALPQDVESGRGIAVDRLIELGRLDLLTDAERRAAIARRESTLDADPRAGRVSGSEQAYRDQVRRELHALGAYR